MAVTRIKNNQITDSTITFQKIASGTLVGSLFNANLTLNSNVSINGNLQVAGNTTTINSIDTLVSDSLITLNNGYVGTPSYDVGVLFNRALGTLGNYGGVNAALVWSESDGAFIVVLTTETGTTAGTINRAFKANMIVGNLTVSNAVTAQTATITTLNVTNTNLSGLTSTGNIVAASGTNATNYTTGAIVVPGGGGVGITGDLWVQGPSTFAGNIVAGNIQLSGNINVPVGGTFSNTGVFFGNAGGIGALYAGTTTYTALPTTVFQMTGNVDTYAQVNFQNLNNGTKASTDFVLTADNGNDTDGYLDLGINSSNFADAAYPGFYPNDGYLVHHTATGDGNLIIFSHEAGSAIKLHVGEYGAANVRATVTNSGLRVNTATASSSTTTGALIVDGGAGVAGNFYLGGSTLSATNALANFAAINNTPIGNATASTGKFTTLIADTGAVEVFVTNAFSTANAIITGGFIYAVTNANVIDATLTNINSTNANIATLVTTNFSSANTWITGGYIDATPVGANTASSGNFTSANALGITAYTVTGTTVNATNGNVTTLYAQNISSSNVQISGATESDSTTTGALTIIGGVGIGANLNVGGNITVLGNLTVVGNTTILNTENLNVEDKNITIAANATNAAQADGAGLTVAGANATFTYTNSDDSWNLNKNLNVSTVLVTTANITSGNITSITSGNVTATDLNTTNANATTLIVTNFSTANARITGGYADNFPVGANTAAPGYFTILEASNAAKFASLNVTANVYLSPQSAPATVTINPLNGGTVDSVTIGSVNAANVYSTNFRATTSLFAAPTGTVWIRGGTGTSGINNIPIGAVTPSSGVFTTVDGQTLTGTTVNATNGNVTTLVATNISSGNLVVSGGYISALANAYITTSLITNFSTANARITGGYADNFPIGANTAATGAFTTLTAASLNNTIIGNTTPAAGTFTSLAATGDLTLATGNIVISSGNTTVYTAAIGTANTTGALVITGSGGAAINGNVYIGQGAVINGNQTTHDTIVRGVNERSLVYIAADSTYDQVSIGGNITTANITQGAKLVVNSSDALVIPVGTSAQRPGSIGFTDVDGMIRFNSTLNALEFYGSGQWNTTGSTFTIIQSRTFSNSSGDVNGNVDGVNTQFTLTSNASTSSTLISINGVVQIPSTAYTVTGNVVTFTEAPAIGDVIDTRVLTTTQTVTGIASTNGFNQYVADDTALKFYTGNVSLGSVENWRMDTHGDFYPVTTANIGYATNRVDYFYVSNINVSGTISGASLSSGSLDDTVIGANIARLGAFTSLFADSTFTTNAEHVTDDIRGKYVAPGGTDAVYGFAIATYRSGKFFVQLSDEGGGEYQAAEVITVHNGTTSSIEVYGVTFTGAANLATFSSNITGGTAYLNASSAGANLKIKVTPTLMKL